jgi:hypothetical protein
VTTGDNVDGRETGVPVAATGMSIGVSLGASVPVRGSATGVGAAVRTGSLGVSLDGALTLGAAVVTTGDNAVGRETGVPVAATGMSIGVSLGASVPVRSAATGVGAAVRTGSMGVATATGAGAGALVGATTGVLVGGAPSGTGGQLQLSRNWGSKRTSSAQNDGGIDPSSPASSSNLHSNSVRPTSAWNSSGTGTIPSGVFARKPSGQVEQPQISQTGKFPVCCALALNGSPDASNATVKSFMACLSSVVLKASRPCFCRGKRTICYRRPIFTQVYDAADRTGD